ncbi:MULTISPECIES: ribosomal protein S18-alanine N-acetyltransferase [Sphingomonas]|uniref:ribosomal protein S18-alanine N-acetyltransferase n=1 Tax=Sphingomonas TaxID=13687 RepID=UPI00083795B0|nr:ribosomal protein S18-alanine N-acetyltransferase [Sphingomonas sp. CCH10-B3]
MSATLNLIELRNGTAADLAVVDGIMRRAFDPRYGEAWTRAQCLGIMAMPGVWLTLANIDGTTVGFAITRATSDEAELLLLATDPRMRRNGVGGALLRSVLNEVRYRAIKQLFLEVRADNEAIGLYRSLGFTKVGERRGYYRGQNGQLFDAYTFRCQIV